MKRINIKKFFEMSICISLYVLISFSCVEEKEKKLTKFEAKFEIEKITQLNNFNVQLKSVITQFINISDDSLLIDMFSDFRKNHSEVDQIVCSIAQKKLIVLSDVFFKNPNQFESLTKNSLEEFKCYLENRKEKLIKIQRKNTVLDLDNFYEKKIEELEQNITTITSYLKNKNKPNH